MISTLIWPLLFSTSYAGTLYPVEIKTNSNKLTIFKIKLMPSEKNILLTGVVKRRSYNSHILPGHIDYRIVDADKQIFKEGIIRVIGLNLRKNSYGRAFELFIEEKLPQNSIIQLSWHSGKMHLNQEISI
jgi:hypothetical protein